MNGPLAPRSSRATVLSTVEAAARPAAKAADDDLTTDQQATVASQHAAFDFEAAERAELERERDLLQSMLMEELKNEDEIVKKWIALI